MSSLLDFLDLGGRMLAVQGLTWPFDLMLSK
jgi:hypothetical protein